MPVYKIIEMVATSDKSFSEAVKAGYAEAKKSIHGIRNITIVSTDVKVKEDEDKLLFRVRMQLSFELD